MYINLLDFYGQDVREKRAIGLVYVEQFRLGHRQRIPLLAQVSNDCTQTLEQQGFRLVWRQYP